MNRAADWFKDAVFYELPVKAFADSDGDGVGDFRGLTEKLDYLVELGVDCLWLLPMYPSPLLVVVATVAMALEQIDVGHGVMHTAFAIVFGGVMLAAAIAFGLGGRHAARRFLDETLLTRNKNVDRDGGSHM